MISDKILRKYKLIPYVARRTNTDRRKLSKGLSNVINPNKWKRGFVPNLYKVMINFYNRDSVSTALCGKRDAKKVKQGKPSLQKWVLSDYLSNLHQKLVSEHTNMSCSFTSFARMRPKNFVLTNFANRRTCLYTQHQNYALKLKMLIKYKCIPTNPKAFVKYSHPKISSIIGNIKQEDFTYEIWKKVEVVYKGKTCKKWKWSPKPSVMLNSKSFCKRMQRHFAALLAGLQHDSENKRTSKRIFCQIISKSTWILPKIIGADRKMRSSLPIRWRECLLTTSTKNYRKNAPEKNCLQNKEPSRTVIEDSQSTGIVPEPCDYVEAIYSSKPY